MMEIVVRHVLQEPIVQVVFVNHALRELILHLPELVVQVVVNFVLPELIQAAEQVDVHRVPAEELQLQELLRFRVVFALLKYLIGMVIPVESAH